MVCALRAMRHGRVGSDCLRKRLSVRSGTDRVSATRAVFEGNPPGGQHDFPGSLKSRNLARNGSRRLCRFPKMTAGAEIIAA